jgi:hypothetical protein
MIADRRQPSSLSTPIGRMRSACCARATSGHAAAPSPAMNSLRRIPRLSCTLSKGTAPSASWEPGSDGHPLRSLAGRCDPAIVGYLKTRRKAARRRFSAAPCSPSPRGSDVSTARAGASMPSCAGRSGDASSTGEKQPSLSVAPQSTPRAAARWPKGLPPKT